ncbi:GNAT family N-acetyltransferase [Deefgea piscis]|uniref:GNAT family N-acetyltransferase n=1 Tax=Deefgea piscis TaxID=2739061 RepID=A0A6M8SVJ0_9NEIS|nr:GNAT family protein [Deefgea piscis]QKJ66689.1 GNAT family N-acetyltransferase [Deefgea piscis]
MILRAATGSDASFLLALRTDPMALKYMPLLKLDLAAMLTRIAAAAQEINLTESAELMYIIELDGVAVGMVGANQRSPMMRYTEVAYSLLPEWRGKGLATQALCLWIELLLSTGYRRLGALISAHNQPSLTLAARVGFVREGVLRQHFLIAGESQDQVVLGLLASEWPQTLQGSQNVPD